jgi:hypothetical protein
MKMLNRLIWLGSLAYYDELYMHLRFYTRGKDFDLMYDCQPVKGALLLDDTRNNVIQ